MRRFHRSLVFNLGLAVLAVASATRAFADNWPQWRGPAGGSTSRETGLPTKWSADEHIAWKTDLPEWGTSTPAVFGDALFVTSDAEGALLLLKIDKSSGRVAWQRSVGSGHANRKEPGAANRAPKFHNLHNLASPSPVTDGERVIVHFGNGDLASYTFDGRQEWKRNLVADHGRYTIWWGHANSPVLFGDAVISVCMQDSLKGMGDEPSANYVVAHDKRTGKVLWNTLRQTEADAEQCDSYTTPVFFTSSGRPEMIVMGGNQIDAYDPVTGQRFWELPGLVGGRTITGPTAADGLAFVTVGMKGPLYAVKLGGKGRLNERTDVAWKHTDSTPDTCCPVVWGGQVYIVSDSGIATCLDEKTGKHQWKNRLAGRHFKSSPVAADGHVYFLSHDGKCTVVDAAGDFRIVSVNSLNDEFTASPAISDGRLYLRGRKALYAIGK